jgi:Predicted oxidoreductases (related to aryl-alcohol dehydrogenases)
MIALHEKIIRSENGFCSKIKYVKKGDSTLRFKQLGKSDLRVSVIGLGTWAMGGDFWGDSNDDASVATIRKAMDCGINLIDTAPIYGSGHSEEIVGKAVKGLRDKVIIATKCGLRWNENDKNDIRNNLKADSIMMEIDKSLSRLGTDYIDLYQIHWPDPQTPAEEAAETMQKIKKSGKARYIGVSNFDTSLLSRAMKVADITSLQPQFSLLYRDTEAAIYFCKANHIGVLAYGSLCGGILSGKYKEKPLFNGKNEKRTQFYEAFSDAMWDKNMQFVDELKRVAVDRNKPVGQLAINWVNQQDKVTTALVGARTPKQAEENASAGNWELSDDEIDFIDKAYARIFRDS